MKFCIDDANVDAVRDIYERYPVDGVSTNPSILAKTGQEPYEVLTEIRSIIKDDELFVQVVSENAEGMIKEVEQIKSVLGDNTLIKIPCTPEGFKAMKLLNAINQQFDSPGDRMLHGGIDYLKASSEHPHLYGAHTRFAGTAIYTTMQGIIATKCGAEYVAPYVNRIYNLGADGVQVAKDIHDAIHTNGMDYGGLLAASFKNVYQVLELVKYGVKSVTVAPNIIEDMFNNSVVDNAVKVFTQDFENLTEPGRTMLDC